MLRNATAAVVAVRSPGRPRSEKARKAVIRSTLSLLNRTGFHELSIEAVAAHAGVGKATVYRWWSNKAELVIDAFVSAVEKELRFPSAGPVLESLHVQMRRWAVIFRSPLGQIVATVIGAGQSEPEILEAFRSHWVEPRRVEARRLLRQAMSDGEIRADIDPDTALDLLYGPLYIRLLLKHAPLDEDFVDMVFAIVSPVLSIKSGLQSSTP
ncbi:MAG: TetR family transcriptional regulator [Acidobacteria bacterium]|nr:MAG: TetR family transcriptional regulator [Acidobacteriota bacterium]